MINKLIATTLIALFFTFSTYAQKKSITLEDVWTKGTFSSKGVAGFNSLNDERYFCNLDDKQNLLRFEFASGNIVDTIFKKTELISSADQKPISFYSFEFSTDESKILIPTQTEHIYRHSSKSVFYVFDLNTRKLSKPVADKIMYATFSPDGKKIAYVKENNLYYFDLKRGVEEKVTTDGAINNIINGATDWVYEEEFGISKAFFWSPNSDKIAFYRFNESKVKEFEMTMYGKLYPEQSKFKYPKAGEANSVVNIFVYDVASQLLTELEIGKETDIYIPRIQWTMDNNVACIQRLNRLQNKLELLLADATNGKSRIIFTEENKYYIDITDNLTFLSDGKSFIITSERDGYNHIYQYKLNGKLIKQITRGQWDVDAFYGVDEKKKVIYYSASEKNPVDRYTFSIGLNGKNKKPLTTRNGWNSSTFNSAFSYFLNNNSTINTPPVYSINNSDGKELRVLENNEKLVSKMSDYKMSNADFTTFKNEAGTNLFAWVIKPTNFDPTKKYPVLMYVYGGPGHQLATNRWSGGNYFWYEMLADKGYMIVCTDGRGTGFRGEQFKKVTYLQLGKYEIEDQIAVAKELQKLPYVDAGRIGIWGWSFGGYMASLGISKGADVFKAAIAVAPVTNWRYYDNIYTERFMRTPQENGENYDINSPINHVSKIKGNFLLIHGTADDNVHFQNTVEMVDAMIQNGVKFDSEFYPNKNHGIGGSKTRLHLYERMTSFILEKL